MPSEPGAITFQQAARGGVGLAQVANRTQELRHSLVSPTSWAGNRQPWHQGTGARLNFREEEGSSLPHSQCPLFWPQPSLAWPVRCLTALSSARCCGSGLGLVPVRLVPTCPVPTGLLSVLARFSCVHLAGGMLAHWFPPAQCPHPLLFPESCHLRAQSWGQGPPRDWLLLASTDSHGCGCQRS